MLVCVNCATVVVFGSGGWEHADASVLCDAIDVAWPPPDEGDEAESAA